MIFAVAVATTVFWACKNDDNKASGSLLGEWRVEKLYVNNQEQLLDECDKTGYIKIAQNTLTSYDYELNSGGVCELENVEVSNMSYTHNTITTTIGAEQHTFTYAISDNKLTMTENHSNGDKETVILIRK